MKLRFEHICVSLVISAVLISASCTKAGATNGAVAPSTPADQVSSSQPVESKDAPLDKTADTPEEVCKQFYSWYLSELRAGHEPAKDDKGLAKYLTAELIQQERTETLPPDFDRVLGLPGPTSDWMNMTVDVGKTTYYHKKGLYDAYVIVTYKGFTDKLAAQKKGMVSIIDRMSIGLVRAQGSWRIASIGIADD